MKLKGIFFFLLSVLMTVTLTSCAIKYSCEDGHTWKKATCTQPQICKYCNLSSGEALGHSWEEATCTYPIHCAVCKETKGEPNGHVYAEAVVTKEASCFETGINSYTCTTCGEPQNEEIPTLAHTPGEWEVILQATATRKGKRAQKCSVCGGTVAEEEFEKTADEIKADYKLNCSDYTYNEISRNPNDYEGKFAHFKGQIIQSMESDDSYIFRVNITKTTYGYTDTIMVSYTKQDISESRLLEDDIVDMYGLLAGTYTYEAIWGNSVTVPLFYAEYVELS